VRCGDGHGHSSAKLFILPGIISCWFSTISDDINHDDHYAGFGALIEVQGEGLVLLGAVYLLRHEASLPVAAHLQAADPPQVGLGGAPHRLGAPPHCGRGQDQDLPRFEDNLKAITCSA
jgi:hypothetical protein